jgi:two-component system sensor kinase FixL
MFALSYTTKPTGSGVGLAISRSIIDAHGGELWAQPNPDAGAEFSFTVPCEGTAM